MTFLYSFVKQFFSHNLSSSFSIHMEHQAQRAGAWFVIWFAFHQVGIVIPPISNALLLFQRVCRVVVRQSSHGKKQQGFLIEIDGVIADACQAMRLQDIGPYFIVAPFVFFYDTGFEFHDKCVLFHNNLLCRLMFLIVSVFIFATGNRK